MNLSARYEQVRDDLITWLSGLTSVDCHEHLVPEYRRVERQVDVLTLFYQYTFVDAVSAGMPTEGLASGRNRNFFLDTTIPLEERWKLAWPWLQQIHFGTYYRPSAIALRDLFDIEGLGDSNYQEVSARLQAANTKGLYHRILRDKCNLRTALVQNGQVEGQDPPDLLTPLFRHDASVDFSSLTFLRSLEEEVGKELASLDEYLEAYEGCLRRARAAGAVGFKLRALCLPPADTGEARAAYLDVKTGKPATPVLAATVRDWVLRKASEWDWPVAIHTGVWGDFRPLHPEHVIGLAQHYPALRMDVYHLGMPYAREAIFLAKSLANVHLNLGWCYSVSQEITRRSITELLDIVPVNKVFGFGGDYTWAVENVYGHLVMARETIAEALAERIASGKLDLDGAKFISEAWLHDNPAKFYGLE